MKCKKFVQLKLPQLSTRAVLAPAPKGFTRVLETGAPAVEKQMEDFEVRNYVRNSKKPVASSKSKAQEQKKR